MDKDKLIECRYYRAMQLIEQNGALEGLIGYIDEKMLHPVAWKQEREDFRRRMPKEARSDVSYDTIRRDYGIYSQSLSKSILSAIIEFGDLFK